MREPETIFQEIKYLSRYRCSICGGRLPDGTHFNFGWNTKGEAIVAGECHAAEVAKLFRREHHDHYHFEMPEWDQTIWRYLDFAKFVSMVSQRSIFFCRTDKLGDKYEGAKGLLARKDTYEAFYRSFFENAVRTVPGGTIPDERKIAKDVERLLKQMEAAGSIDRERTYVNCWYAAQHESYAMWNLYGAIGRSIAIRSSPRRLFESLGRNFSIKIGAIKYVNFRESFSGINSAFWNKHISFEHEKEVRALFRQHQKAEEAGITFPCDLASLIDEVVLSPSCETWFESLVANVLGQYGLSTIVRRSALEQEPFY